MQSVPWLIQSGHAAPSPRSLPTIPPEMPELPDITVHLEAIEARVIGEVLEEILLVDRLTCEPRSLRSTHLSAGG